MGTSASFARKALSCLAAALLAFTLVPAGAFAGQESTEFTESSGTEGSEGVFGSEAPASPQSLSNPSSEADSAASDGTSAEGGTLAASLMGRPASFVNADVALDGEPVIGSFTVDGMTFAVTEGSNVELVGVSNSEAIGSTLAAPDAEAEGSASEATAWVIALPESVAYNDVEYAVTSIGAYAFYLSGVTSVELPASVIDVDDRAFRSSDIASVEVDEGNPTYSSFDGVLYSADQSSLLLIPEGKQGAVLLPKETEVAQASKFSHCSLVDAISAEDGAAFASENGLLYDASLTTLLRVPAGATEITIREGCTTIAAGAMEGCASLATINAPASVTSISSDIFTSMPTVSLPASAIPCGANEVVATEESSSQIRATFALSVMENSLFEINPATISVDLHDMSARDLWEAMGFAFIGSSSPFASLESGATYGLYGMTDFYFHFSGTLSKTSANYPSFGWSRDSSPQSTTDSGPVYNMGGWIKIMNGSDYGAYGLNGSYAGVTKIETYDAVTNSYIEWPVGEIPLSAGTTYYLNGHRVESTITWNLNYPGASLCVVSYPTGATINALSPSRVGFSFEGWYTDADCTIHAFAGGEPLTISESKTYYAKWHCTDINLSFDVSAEPKDDDYLGNDKPDETITANQVGLGKQVAIEDPKRPGYVFQGWVIPDADGEHAIDQDLVYKDETDGKWYVDASKLPDYAGDDGRVELTARWTSVISVDVPSAATFYYDLVTDQSSEAHEAALSGTTSFSSRSQVDLRVCGLESVKASGANALFSSGADGALLSVYPAKDGSAATVEDAQGPAGEKPSTAVDFALDDIVLEAAFSKAGADAFSIPAGDDLALSYRLNLGDGASLDYDKVLSMAEGDEASLASISYCFAANYDSPADWGEPLWIENPDTSEGAPRFLVLDDIKAAAEDLSTNGTSSVYYDMYKGMLDRQVMSNGNPGEGPYFQLRVDGVYLPVQLIGICQDTKSDGAGKAGLTFQMRDIYAYGNVRSAAAGGGVFNTYMNPSPNTNAGGWKNTAMRSALRSTFWGYLPKEVQSAIVLVDKYQQMPGGTNASKLDKTTSETIWLPSMYEVFGISFAEHNEAEALTNVAGYEPFQYMAFQPGGTGDTNIKATKAYNGFTAFWGLRSARRYDTVSFCRVDSNGSGGSNGADSTWGSVPCFCL